MTRSVLSLTLALAGTAQSAETDLGKMEFFENKIRPVLVQKCYRCHSEQAAKKKRLKGNLYLDSKNGIRKGGDTGPAVVPNDVSKSLIIRALRYESDSLEMPPSGKLPETVVADFVKWINLGAPDPRNGSAAQHPKAIDIEAGRRFWSIRPLQNAPVPTVKQQSWPLTPVDHFILARLEEKGINPVPPASSATLVRRLTMDLHGLPPTPEQLKAYEKAAAEQPQKAWSQLIDRLLQSPRFGERWGRHWLDVARFAESNGGTKNTVWPDAWRYRRYVIDALNNEKPYPLFIREQLAGDLLPFETTAQQQEQKVATAFLAMGSKEANATRMEIIGEQLDVVGRAFLGLSIGCARCHDHKFDPIPTKDFYGMAGILLNTQIQDGKPFGSLIKVDKAQRGKYKNFQRALSTAVRAKEKAEARLAELSAQAKVRQWPGQPWKELISHFPSGPRTKAESALNDLKKAQLDLEKLRQQGPPEVFESLAVADRPAKGRKFLNAKIHIRGSEGNLGEEVPRGVIQVLTDSSPQAVGEEESGRLQMAQVIHRHPLASRVMVNRIWHHLFGRGLVPTVDNFGGLGEAPSHPQLLEWLANRFSAENGSMKKLIRLIVQSRAYQLSSDVPQQHPGSQRDPENVLVWRHKRRRMDAELIRDAILSAAGQLDLKPPDRFEAMAYHAQMADLTAMDRIRKRAVYLPVHRGLPTDVMAVFNFPPADLVVGKREAPSVPTQALFLLNSPLVIQSSQQMALRLLGLENQTSEERIDQACLLVWGRSASDSEKQEAISFLEQHKKQNSRASEKWQQLDAWATYCQSLFCAAEFRFIR